MIYESSYWKDDLLRYAAALRKKTKQRHWSERSQAVVEKLVFLGFYSVRKLFEAEKLSTSLRQLSLVTAIYPPTGKNVTRHNWHKTDELFHLDCSQSATITLPQLANQAIHSYVFQLGFTHRNTLSFMLICSDHQRDKGLHHVWFRDVIRVFERVGRNYPHKTSFVFDPELKDYRIDSE